MNENVLKGKWREIKGEVQKAWGKLTDDELEKTKGDMNTIGGLIQQKYGHAEADYHQKLDDIFSKFKTAKDQTAEDVKDRLKKTS